ncbi:MAG: signal peptide peptidase SppA [Desulfobulbaceae bacterium]|nr:signal peptide peptidase SppA [Desulfobulbaceae bacterium]
MKKFFQIFGRIFYWLWKLLTTGCLVFTHFVVLVFLLLFLAFFFQPQVRVPEGSALILAPKGVIVEKATAISPISRIINGFAGIPIPRETLLQDILDAVNTAAIDEKIKIIVLSLDEMESSSLNQLNTIGLAINAFKKTGKKVIAASDQYSQGQYYLASYADEIFLNPMGNVSLRGFGVYGLYIKELIDRLAINFHIFRVGTYKSSTEPFLRNDMSAEAKEANRLWLNNLWERYCRDIADNRGLKADFLNTFINEMPEFLRQAEGSMSRMVLAANLVDGIKTRPEIDQYLSSIVGRSADDRTFNNIDFTDYLKRITPSFTKQKSGSDNHIGIIIATGNIMYGEKIPGQISSEDLCRLIREAGKDEKIKALVLRIDSGGGSALASELIRRELLRLQEAGKPLVVSMGAVAASGAYWLSAPADRIIASPATLTGSIGIFGIFPTFEESIAKIGMHSDGIATTRMAGAANPTIPLSPELGKTIQLSIEEGYDRFLSIVAEGRGIPMEKVKKLAQGRVWDGTTARELGLVDEFGTLGDAITAAAELAGLGDYDPLYVREKGSSGNEILRQFGLEMQHIFEPTGLFKLPAVPYLDIIGKNFDLSLFNNDPSGIYAHCLLPHSPASL